MFKKLFQHSSVIVAILLPFLGLALQWELWHILKPFVWFLFFPTVFFSARLSGLRGGVPATVISALIVIYFFIPPQLSWTVENHDNLYSVVMFLIMGYLFSDTQERLNAAKRRTQQALDETKEANTTITKLYEKTKELDELKSQFFANISHELRTPLTLILEPVGRILAQPELDQETRHGLEVVQRNARMLLKQVNNLLDLSRLDAKRLAVQNSTANLVSLVRLTASFFESNADNRNIRFVISTPERLIAVVDQDKVERIVLNLLSNAFKFTPDGGEISLELTADEQQIRLQVADSGPGIPLNMRQAVFERFTQVEGHAARKHGGAGLGLSIVYEFTKLLEGEISIGDAPGGGALFTLSLPFRSPGGEYPADSLVDTANVQETLAELELDCAPRLDVPALIQNDPNKSLILVVEDNPDMNEFLVSVLKPTYRVISAINGQDGLEKAQALLPDLIVTDLMMPGMSGDQMVAAIRQTLALARTPVVILTAKSDDALRLRLLHDSVQDFLQKPFSSAELLARIRGLLAERAHAAADLALSEERYRSLAENSEALILTVDAEGCCQYANPAALRLFNRPAQEIIGMHLEDLVPAQALNHHLAAIQQVIASGSGIVTEGMMSIGGAEHYLRSSIQPIRSPDGQIELVLINGVDLTGRRQAEHKLELALAEKEVLLREVHHRVRNNLYTVIGLIDLQRCKFDNQEYAATLNELETQARTMSMVYENLYESENLAILDMNTYLENVVLAVVEVFGLNRMIRVNVSAHADLNVPEAMPCGLIVNELLSTLFQYTFPADFSAEAKIMVELERQGDTCTLCVKDDGTGSTLKWFEEGPYATSMQLVKMWTEHQLGGRIEVFGPPGNVFKISFAIPNEADGTTLEQLAAPVSIFVGG